MFLFRRNKVVVDCFTSNSAVFELSKIDYAHKYSPQGWKSLPAVIEAKANLDPESSVILPIPTIKKCPGLSSLFTTGFILPSWTDMTIEVKANGKFSVFDPGKAQRAEQHPEWLWWNGLYEGYTHIKFKSPWFIKEKSGINFLWHECDWHNTERISDFHVLSGIVDYRAQHQTNINVFMKKNSIVKIKVGDPLVHIVPLTDKEIELRHHLINDSDDEQIIKAPRILWFGQHRALLQAKQNNESKCPFGFGKK
jgi:hypothetical protein